LMRTKKPKLDFCAHPIEIKHAFLKGEIGVP